MAYKYREEIVGKRFLSVSGYSKLKFDKIGEWGWRAGVIRAATHKDNIHKDLQVLVEYDDVEWHRREWISIYKDSIFHMFLVEHGLVWGHRSDPFSNSATSVLWPALTFASLVSAVDLAHNQQPLEFLLDKELTFCDYKQLKPFQEWDVSLPGIRDYLELRAATRRWTEQQDGQRILLATPSVLVGYRVEVYRAEGTTQWYTAVIVGYNEATRDLTVTDDTVLEEHNEDPALVQMRLIGDGVVESIMRGENVGITARRSRSAVLQAQHQQPSRVVRVTASSAVNTRKPRIGKPTLVSDPVLQTSPEPPDKVLVTTKPIRKRKSSENNEPSCQGASVVATLRLRSTPHYNNHNNNSPSSIKEDLENNKHLSRSRKTSGAGTAVVCPNSAAGNNNSSQQFHQQPQRNKKKLLEETNSSKIRNLHVRVEDCLQIAARSEALSVICRRNSEEKSASRSNLSSTLATFSTPSTSPTPSVTVLDNQTPTTPLTQSEGLSSIEEGATEDESSTVGNTNLHDSSSRAGSSNSGSSPPTPLPTLNTLTPPPTVDVIDLADSASSCDTANSCSGGGSGGGDSTNALQLSGTGNTCSAISSDAALDAELLVTAVATASHVDDDDNEDEHNVHNLHKSTVAQWKPCALGAEDVDNNSGSAALVAAITVQLNTGTKDNCTAIEATPTSESALTAETVPAVVDTTSCADANGVVNVVHVISDNRTVVEEVAVTAAGTFPSATIVTVEASVVGVTAVTECTDRTATGESTETTVTAGSTVTITTRPLRTSEPCGGHPAVVDDERPATPLLQQMYSGGIATGSGRMETSSVGSVGSVGSDSSATTAATSVATGAAASPAPPNSSAVSGGESLLRFVVAGGGSNGGSDDRSDSGVSSLRSGSSGDERSGSRSSALSSSGDDLIAAQVQQQQQQQTVSQPHQQLVRDREQGGGVVQGGGRSSRSPVTVFGSAGVSGGREEHPVRVWRDPALQSENEPHIRHIHSIQHQMKLSQSIDQSRKHMYNSLLMSHPSTNPAVAAAAAAGVNVSVSSNSNGVASISRNSPLSLATSSSSVTGGSSTVATVTSTLSAAVAAAAVAQHLYNPAGQPQGIIAQHPGLVPPQPPPMSQSASANATAIYAAELMWKQQQQHADAAAAIAASRGASWPPPPPTTSSSAAAAAAAAVQAQLQSVANVAEEERRLLVERERERAYQDRERHERLLREQQHDRVREIQAKEQQHMHEREQREKQDHHHHTQHSQLHHHQQHQQQQQQQQQQQRERYEQHERQFRHDQQQRDRERDHLLLREKDQQQQERERQKTQGSAEMVDQHFKESLKRAQHKSSSAAWPLMSIQSPSSASSVSVSQQQQQHRNAASVAAAAAAVDEERKRLERLEMLEHMQRVDQQRAAAVADHQQQQQRHHHHHHHLATSTNQINQQRIESSSRYYSSSSSVNQRPSSVPSSVGKAPPPITEYHPPPAHSRSNSGSSVGPSTLGSTKGHMDKQHPAHPASGSAALPYHHAHVHHQSSQPQHKSNNELSAAAAAAAAAAASLHGYPTYQPTTFFAAATAAAAAAAGREHHNIHPSSSGGTGHHKGLSQQHHSALKEHAGLTSGLSPSMMAAAVAAAEHKNSVIVKHEKSLGSNSHHLEARSSTSIAHSPGPPKMPPLGGHYLAGGPPTQAHKLYEYRSPTQSPHHLTPSPHHLSGESKNHHRSPSGPPLVSPHHVHHPPPPPHQQASSHHPVHHGLHQQSQQSPQQQQQQPPHHRQSPHGLSPGLVSSQQQQQTQQHSAHGGGRYRTTSEPPVHQSHHVQHYMQQQHLSQRERDREEQRSKVPPGPPGAAYASYPHPSTLTGAGASIYAPPIDHRLVAGSSINSAPSLTTTPPATSGGGSSSGKPKVSSPAPHQIFGKPCLTPPGTSTGSSAASPIPLTATKGHHLAVSPSPYQQMQPYSLPHNQVMSAAPPPAHSRDAGGSRYMYERYPTSSAKPIIQHGAGSVSVAGQPPISTISSGAMLPTRHHHSHTSTQQPPPPQQPPIHHIPHHPHHVVGHPQLTQQPQYIQPAAHAVQTQPLDLGISSSNNTAKYEPSLSPKRKAITPLQNTAPICLEVKKRRMELTNNAMNNATGVPSTNIYQQHDPHNQLLVQGQAHTSPQPTPPSVAVLSRVSEPTPLVSTAAATTITTVVNASLYNHPSTVNTTINLCANAGRNADTVSANMQPHSPGTLSAVLPDVSVTAVTTASTEGRITEELSLQSSTGAVPLLSTTTDGTTTDTKSIGLSITMNMTPPPASLTPTQVNASNSPVTIKTEPGLIAKTEPAVSVMTELGNISDNDKANRSSPLTTAPTTTQSSSSTYNNSSSYPVRHLKKAWLQRHTTGEHVDKPESSYSGTFPYNASASSSASGNGSAGVTPSVTTATPTILTSTTREPGMVNSLHNIGSMAVNSINKSKHFQSKSNNRKGTKDSSSLNGDISKDDSSSSDQDRGRKSPPKRKPPKVKRRKGIMGRKPSDKKNLKTGSGGGGGSTGGGSSVLGSESGSDSDKDTGSDKDSDSGASITPLKKPSNGNSVAPPVSLNSAANNVLKDNKGQEPRKRGRRPKTKNDNGEEPRIKKAKDQNTENFRGTVDSEDNNASAAAAAAEAAIAAATAAIAASTLSTIVALTVSSNAVNTGGVVAPPRDPFRKPPVGQLKKTGETFLQDGPCFEVAPKLAKCRECRWTPNQRSKNMPNIFCRFYAFRRLRYTKNGQLAIAGFSDPHTDAYEDDIKLWLPSSDTPPTDLDLETSRFILRQVGDHFCNLLVQEKEAHLEHMSDDKTIAWKRVVQGVREMCDVCETTLFNFHWACGKCGFVVCLDCYKGRKRSIIKIWCDSGRDRDEYSWLLCTNRSAHEQERLMLTQIIAGDSLNKLGKLMHEMRELWHVDQHCNCALSKEIGLAAMKTNGIRKEMIRGLIKMEMNGMKREIKEEAPQQQNGQKEGWSPSTEIVSSANEDKKNDDSDSEGSYSHLRELLTSSTIRPKQPNGSRAESPTSTQPLPPPSMPPMKKKPKLDSVDEVIFSVIEDSVPRPDSHCNNPFAESRELRHYIPRDNAEMKYRGLLPIRVLTLTESKVLYPCIPHNWLCHGKLLRLSDSTHTGNYRIFQDQWKRGQPVLVSDVTKHMDRSLWTPESFASDFGDEKNDLVNCLTGNIVPNQPMRKFWEGFENFSKRLKDDSGNPMLLKLKDWPPAEDFAEMLPSRFTDLMKVLPLSEYTHRGGRLNLAGRLPDCFVRPDLGPKMYNAYGSAIHPSKGTTNLHLDISDAVNVMVYVGIPKDGNNDEHIKEAFRAIDDAGCDILTKRRIRDKGELPGALWHIYNARDADKIRDLLNKMVVESGGELKPNHDPIHDQSRYLDGALRERLYKEYGVEGYAIVQCLGDAVFIPAGAPHQVRNLHNCIKVAEDFVSPENVSQCFHLTQEFRELSHAHANHEDKLQIKNIIYHAVKDSLSTLSSILNKHLSADNTIGTTVPNASDAKAEIKIEIKSEID